MSFDMTRREALGVLGAAAGTLLVVPLSVMTGDNKNGDWKLPFLLSDGLSKSVTTGPLKAG